MNISRKTLYILLIISVIIGIFIQLIANLKGAYFTIPLAVYLFFRNFNPSHSIFGKIKTSFRGGIFGAISVILLILLDPLFRDMDFGDPFFIITIIFFAGPIGFISGMIFGFLAEFLIKNK